MSDSHEGDGRPIPFLDLRRLHRSIRDELDAAYDEVLQRSGFVGSGTCRDFEDDFAGSHGLAHAVGCGSGTDALMLALRALEIGPGDEVVVPAMTFVATATSVVHAGATPVMVDVDPDDLLVSREAVAAALSDRTKAVMPVHLYGNLVPPGLMDEWRSKGLLVVEDAAQAHLAVREGRGVGQSGSVSCFSFYPGKNLGALGDGGILATPDREVAERARALRDHGQGPAANHLVVGYCSRLDGLQAAFLRAKLRHLPEWTEARRSLARRYRERLADVPGVRLVEFAEGAVHHLLVVRIAGGRRDQVRADLAARGIGTGIHYPFALSEQPALAAYARPCPEAERAAPEILSLPIDPLMTPSEVDAVCRALRGATGGGQ